MPLIRRGLTTIGVLAALYFAIQGGEFGTTDLIAGRRERGRLVRNVDSVQRIVDSLTRYRRRLETDAALQERIAREVFGMVKNDKEIVYRFVDTDSTVRDTTSR